MLSGTMLSLAVMPVLADQVSIGQAEYESSCASCHGVDAKGQGPFAELLSLTGSPPDLTRLQANNDGVFPFERVYRVIDGREEVKFHGPREMPIWGKRYSDDALDMGMVGEMMIGREAYTRSRILALISYLSTLQE
ncbi:c-type cytochrome [Halomonas getboli]|uniref:c-type cytochrome n=1 Tax=Halomonas getboli TaxID=2935862 RepID=UPI002000338F|nr:cytochrome c [Halomonas getboli]MCK2184087.1 cytochrome c [Halomonas getboli]